MGHHSALVVDANANDVAVHQLDESFWDGEPGRVGRQESLSALRGPSVDIDVAWSSINYKDALAVVPGGGVARRSPLVPGIDLAGVVRSAPPGSDLRVGDVVLAHGHELGVAWHGGFSTFARVPEDWVIPVPDSLAARDVMIFGTAGYTAALSVMALENKGCRPDGGPVLVTGASGGVGSCAVAMLAARGYEVVASTGKSDKRGWLRQLGAAEVVDRAAIASSVPARPLEAERWQSAVDVVGGQTLASVLRSVAYGGSVATSGLAGSAELQMTVHPFILRAVNLIGIDSAYNTRVQRIDVWNAIAQDFAAVDRELLVAGEIALVDVPDALVNVKEAAVAGRLLVDLSR